MQNNNNSIANNCNNNNQVNVITLVFNGNDAPKAGSALQTVVNTISAARPNFVPADTGALLASNLLGPQISAIVEKVIEGTVRNPGDLSINGQIPRIDRKRQSSEAKQNDSNKREKQYGALKKCRKEDTKAIGTNAEPHLPILSLPPYQQRITAFNFSAYKSDSHDFLLDEQLKYGFTFEKTTSKPDVKPLFISARRWMASFTIHSRDEFSNVKKWWDDEKMGYNWHQKFQIESITKNTPLMIPFSLSSDEAFRAVLIATKKLLEEKNGCHKETVELQLAIQSSNLLEAALNCTKTNELMNIHLNNRGKSILKRMKRDEAKEEKTMKKTCSD